MAAPNPVFIPEIANEHLDAAFFEIMDFLSSDLGLIDFVPATAAGDYVHRPQVGQLSATFARADVKGTLTTALTATTSTNTDQVMVALHRTLLHEYFVRAIELSDLKSEQYSAGIGRQMAVKAAQKMLSDIYGAAAASCRVSALDHEEDVYVDTGTAASQVDLTATVLQGAKLRMTDHMESLDYGICHNKQWNDMRVDLISNDDFRVPNIVGDVIRGNLFRTVLGVTFIVDDQIGTTAGPTTGSPTKYEALLLRSRAQNPEGRAPITIAMKSPLVIYEQHVLGAQSRKNQLQGEVSYAIGFPGSAWDVTNGGANPTDADLTTTSNWDEANDDNEQHGIVNVRTN